MSAHQTLYEIRTMGQKIDYILLRLEELSAALNITPRLAINPDSWADTIKAGAKIVNNGDGSLPNQGPQA